MNLLHLADLHLGKRVNGFDLLPDQRYILEQVLDLCTAHNVQAVALAGDIYDTALPPAAAVLLLDWFLTELAHRNIPVLAIAGNHDSAERLDYAAGLLSNQQVYLAGQFTSAPRRVILQDEFGELTFDLLPFVRPATVRHCLPDADIRDEDSAIAAALGPLPTAGERRVLIAHQMVLGGGSLPTCSGSESVAADVKMVFSLVLGPAVIPVGLLRIALYYIGLVPLLLTGCMLLLGVKEQMQKIEHSTLPEWALLAVWSAGYILVLVSAPGWLNDYLFNTVWTLANSLISIGGVALIVEMFRAQRIYLQTEEQ